MNKNVPKLFLDIIITWHDGLYCRVRWNGHYSDWFHISAGVRQGGVLSPDLYCLYVDELVDILKSMGIGCYVRQRFAAALFYADDMAVLAPSIKGLQSLLDACAAYCSKWDIKLNAKKTKNLFFGKGAVPNHRITLDGTQLPWESSCVYLGVTLKQGVHFGEHFGCGFSLHCFFFSKIFFQEFPMIGHFNIFKFDLFDLLLSFSSR